MIDTSELKHLEATLVGVLSTHYKFDNRFRDIIVRHKNMTDDICFNIVLLCCVRYYVWAANHVRTSWVYPFYDTLIIRHPNHFTHIDDIQGIKIETWTKIQKGMFVNMYYDDKIYRILTITANNYVKPELWVSSTYYNLLNLI